MDILNIVRNTKRLEDYNQNNYWVPDNVVFNFKEDLLGLQNESHDDYEYNFNKFTENYGFYKCVDNDPTKMPTFFEENIKTSNSVNYNVEVFQKKGSPLNGMVNVDGDRLRYCLVSSNKGVTLGGVQYENNQERSASEKRKLRKLLDEISEKFQELNGMLYPERYEK